MDEFGFQRGIHRHGQVDDPLPGRLAAPDGGEPHGLHELEQALPALLPDQVSEHDPETPHVLAQRFVLRLEYQ